MIITAPNGEKKDFPEDMKWVDMCNSFGVFEGWFEIEEDEGPYSLLILNGKTSFAMIDDDNVRAGSGIWADSHFVHILDLTKEEAERRGKLLAFT